MNSVSPVELAKRVLELLQVKPGQSIDLAKLRDGSVLLKRCES
jgi:hypothetical protein